MRFSGSRAPLAARSVGLVHALVSRTRTRPVSLILLLLLPFAGSAVAACLPTSARNLESASPGWRPRRGWCRWRCSSPRCATAASFAQRIAWLPDLGLDFVAAHGRLRLDVRDAGHAASASLVVLYARYYMSPADPVPRFFSFLLAFMGAMLGVVLSGNLIQLVFFWELTSLFSFLLIGYWHHRADARARRAHGARSSPRPAACACSPACCCSGTSSAATSSTRARVAATRSARTRCTRRRWC